MRSMKLEKNEVARIVTSPSKLVSIENLLKETCWETFFHKGRNINNFAFTK